MKNLSTNQYTALHGFYVGIIMVTVSLMFYFTTGSLISDKGFASWAPTVLFTTGLYFFTRQYRNQHSPTYFTYGKAFNTAFMIGLYANLILTFFYYLMFKFSPDILHQILLMSQKSFQESGMSETELETMMKTFQIFLTPGIAALSNFFGILLQTTLIALILALFLQRKMLNTPASGFDRDMTNID